MYIPFSETTFKPERRHYNYTEKGKTFNVIGLGTCSYAGNIAIDCFNYEKYLPNILIGNFCSIGKGIKFFMGYNHEYKNVVTTFPFDSSDVVEKISNFANLKQSDYFPKEKRHSNHFQIIVGNDVWIGDGVTITGGVKIGSGAIIGTNAVVAKDIPPYAIVVGNPAREMQLCFLDSAQEQLKKILMTPKVL